MSAHVAVAVVSWNTRELLDRCLRSLAPEVEAGAAEVWVVDNGSTDGSIDVVRSHPFARLIASAANLGYGRAVNLVAGRTSTPWIAPANADVELTPGALGRMLQAGQARPAAGIIAARLVLPEGSTQHSVYRFPTIPTMALYNAGVANVLPSLGDRFALHGSWQPRTPSVDRLGNRRVLAGTPHSLGAGGRIRSKSVDVRRGPRPGVAPTSGRLEDMVRAVGCSPTPCKCRDDKSMGRRARRALDAGLL